MPETAYKKWFLLSLLCFAGAMVYTFPFLRYSYYDTMKEALHVNDIQMGNMQMLNGVASTLGYIPGGWLADRYSSRKLLFISLMSTGLSGFYFATFPSYIGGLFLYLFWGFSTLIIFWAPFIKATRELGPDEEQGRLFGFLEGGRGVIGSLVGIGTLVVFTKMGEGPEGLKWVIYISSVITIIAAIAIWFFFEDSKLEKSELPTMKDFKAAMKIPQVWIIGMIIFCGYGLFAAQSYITPYMTSVLGAAVSFGALMGILRTYGLQAIGAPGGGILTDKIGSASKVIMGAFTISLLCMIGFLWMPSEAASMRVIMALMIILGLCIYVLRGNFYATFGESRIPTRTMGASLGVACFIGYLPEMYTYPMVGHWLEKFPDIQAYRITFIYMIGLAATGIIMACLLLWVNKNRPVKFGHLETSVEIIDDL